MSYYDLSVMYQLVKPRKNGHPPTALDPPLRMPSSRTEETEVETNQKTKRHRGGVGQGSLKGTHFGGIKLGCKSMGIFEGIPLTK